MEMDTAMELSFWKEEPLSPFSGLVEEEADIWELFGDVKQDEQAEKDPLDDTAKQGAWLPDSPSDSCDSLSPSVTFSARAQLASQLLEDLDEELIKEESFDWYESKTGLPMFEELPSPTPSLCKEDALAGVASRPFAGLSLTAPQFAPNVATVVVPAFAPASPAAVHVPLSPVQVAQAGQPPAVGSLQQLEQPQAAPATTPTIGLLMTAQLQLLHQEQQQLMETETLLQELEEFDSVFGKVEQSHSGALTPPQSPPQSPPHHINSHYPANHASAPAISNQAIYSYQPPAHHQQPEYGGGLLATTPQQQQQQQQQQLIELDEIVRSRVQAEEAWPSAAFAPPSPCTSSNSSCSFTSEEPAPASPETDDPDWVPESIPGAAPAALAALASPPGKSTAASRSKRGQARRKPYAANVEDKRQRKKEQNKNAATRYRMKKKAEVEVIVGEENELKEKNDELQAKVADLSQEIRYLKNLMRDLFRARGLIK